MDPEVRAQQGIFLAFQYPVEIPGVSNAYFLRAAYNEIRKARGEEEIDPMSFADLMDEKMKLVEMDEAMLTRSVNTGFSGGEKKRNEILQMAVLEPKLADPRRDRLGPRHRRAAHRRQRREHAQAPRQRDDRRDALPAAAQLHRARLRARARRRADRALGRQGARAGARGQGIRLAARRRRSRDRVVPARLRADLAPTAASTAPEWARSLRLSAITRFEALGFPTTRTRTGTSPPSRRSPSGSSSSSRRRSTA